MALYDCLLTLSISLYFFLSIIFGYYPELALALCVGMNYLYISDIVEIYMILLKAQIARTIQVTLNKPPYCLCNLLPLAVVHKPRNETIIRIVIIRNTKTLNSVPKLRYSIPSPYPIMKIMITFKTSKSFCIFKLYVL